ncbi:GPP34 family phosphoprotein [Frankia sp. Cpl3]|uniref:GOLPH3/VPS74 family protein n=1 Tax=Parafrankia colletiae TaxID=573497 RepID=UPI000A051E23|nr:GPP34 family phosphoprotein [Parafrankia colletiae]MCK9900439.1 GPP34 family phosphoprotein [Frankia sp. Cpl3]
MTPDPLTSLPARLYLLAYNLEKDQLYPNRRLGRALRAAALVELETDGWLVDDEGRVRVAAAPPGGRVAGAGPTPRGGSGRADPLVAAVYRQVEGAPVARSWADWIGHEHRAAVVETRDDLEAAGWIRVARGRALGVFPTSAVVLLPRAEVRAVNRAAGPVLRGEVAPADADPDLARLVALAAAGDVITLVSAGQRRAFAGQLGALTALAGHAARALAGDDPTGPTSGTAARSGGPGAGRPAPKV